MARLVRHGTCRGAPDSAGGGGPGLADDPRFADNAGRLEHGAELDAIIAAWVQQRTLSEALDAFSEADAAAAPIYRMADVFADPHYAARDTVVAVEDDELGSIPMAGVVPPLSATPGSVRWAGRPAGSANEQVYAQLLGLSTAEIAALAKEGVI